MDPAALLHGAAGSLDELLLCGGAIAVFVLVYIVAVLREKPKTSPGEQPPPE